MKSVNLSTLLNTCTWSARFRKWYIAGTGTCKFRKRLAWTIAKTGRGPLPAMGHPIPATHVSSFGFVHFRKRAGPCRQWFISCMGCVHFRKQPGRCWQWFISCKWRHTPGNGAAYAGNGSFPVLGRAHFRKRPGRCWRKVLLHRSSPSSIIRRHQRGLGSTHERHSCIKAADIFTSKEPDLPPILRMHLKSTLKLSASSIKTSSSPHRSTNV